MERMVRLEKDVAIGTTAVVNTEGTRMEDIGTRQRMVMMIGSTITTILTGPERLMVMVVMERKVKEIQEGPERVKRGMGRGGDTGLASKPRPRLTRRRIGTTKRERHQTTGQL